MNIPISSLASCLLTSLLFTFLVSCGTVSPDPPSGPGAFGNCCPSIPATLGTCSDGRIVRATLVCAGATKECPPDNLPRPTLSFEISAAPGGANRFNVQFVNGSRFQGSLISPDPGCLITDGTDIDFTFGLRYTGDQGVEPAADGSGRMVPCITQSKVEWSSFNFDLVGNFIHEGRMKATIHSVLDFEIISQLFGSGLVGRCQRWREMP